MSNVPVTDYLDDLLGASLPAATPAAVVVPAAVVASPVALEKQASAPVKPAVAKPAANSDEITDDEFEALLDELHGDKPPAAVVVAAKLAAANSAASSDEISEDEFEALLDQLHGGKPSGAVLPAAEPAVKAATTVPVIAAAKPVAISHDDNDGDDEAQSQENYPQIERRATQRTSRWLRMHVHKQDYAVELLKVQEVLVPPPVLPMRGTPAWLLGVMNLRGMVVPVMDLGMWLDLDPVEDSPLVRLVVLEHEGETLAIRVSDVLDVHPLVEADIERSTFPLAGSNNAVLRGVTRVNNRPVLLLDALGILM